MTRFIDTVPLSNSHDNTENVFKHVKEQRLGSDELHATPWAMQSQTIPHVSRMSLPTFHATSSQGTSRLHDAKLTYFTQEF